MISAAEGELGALRVMCRAVGTVEEGGGTLEVTRVVNGAKETLQMLAEDVLDIMGSALAAEDRSQNGISASSRRWIEQSVERGGCSGDSANT